MKLSDATQEEGPALGPLQDEVGNLSISVILGCCSPLFSLSNCSFSAFDFRPRFLPAGFSNPVLSRIVVLLAPAAPGLETAPCTSVS